MEYKINYSPSLNSKFSDVVYEKNFFKNFTLFAM